MQADGISIHFILFYTRRQLISSTMVCQLLQQVQNIVNRNRKLAITSDKPEPSVRNVKVESFQVFYKTQFSSQHELCYSNTTVYYGIHERSECISVDSGVTNLIHDRCSCVDFTLDVEMNVARCVHSSVNKPGVKRNSGL